MRKFEHKRKLTDLIEIKLTRWWAEFVILGLSKAVESLRARKWRMTRRSLNLSLIHELGTLEMKLFFKIL